MNTKDTKQLRDEIKQRKQALRDVARVQATSKIGLSKMVTTLEKQTIEDEKKIEILKHKLSQAATEKQMFKQKYETLKAKVKSNETDDIKMIKTISLETREKYTKSPIMSRNHDLEENKQQLKSLQQARKERKRIPLYSSRGENKNSIDMLEKPKLSTTPRDQVRREHKPAFSYDENDDTSDIKRGSIIHTIMAPQDDKQDEKKSKMIVFDG